MIRRKAKPSLVRVYHAAMSNNYSEMSKNFEESEYGLEELYKQVST